MCYYAGHYLYGAKGTIHVLSCCTQQSCPMFDVWDTLNQSQMQGLEAESVQLQLSMLQVLYSTLTMCKGCRPRPPKDVPKTQAYQLGDSNGWSHAELHPYPDM